MHEQLHIDAYTHRLSASEPPKYLPPFSYPHPYFVFVPVMLIPFLMALAGTNHPISRNHIPHASTNIAISLRIARPHQRSSHH